MNKCILCEKKIDWGHHLPPLPSLLFTCDIQKKYCPKCWNRIWTEWYEYDSWGDLCPEGCVTDKYIIAKYKGNDLVEEKPMHIELPKKKKHWWNKNVNEI